MNQIGDAGLRDKVNHHYWSTFGAAAAVGLISGLAQYLGGLRTRGAATAIGRSSSPAVSETLPHRRRVQVMNRFLNRLPTVTVREGHRVKVYLTSDLELPAYEGGGQYAERE